MTHNSQRHTVYKCHYRFLSDLTVSKIFKCPDISGTPYIYI